MSKKKDTFIFKKSWADALKKRSAEVQLEVYNAIVSYAVDGVIPQMSEIAEVVFDFIRIEIDENNAKYDEVCKKRSQAGKKGMNSRYGKLEEYEQVEEPVQPVDNEVDDNKPNKDNKTEQDVINLTNVNKSNKPNRCYQKVTNVTDSDSDSVSVNISADIKKETISDEIVKKEDELLSLPLVVDAEVVEQDNCDDFDLIDESIIVPPKTDSVDYVKIVNLYHEICVEGRKEPLARVLKLNDDRKKKIKMRFKEMGSSYEKVAEVFRAVMESDFLIGKNNRGWAADLPWIFQNSNNWLNILEGKYSNREKVNAGAEVKSQLETNVGFLQRAGVKKEDVIF